jgi:hypothetical protein
LDQYTYGLNARTSLSLTPRLSWNVGGNLTSTYAQDANVLIGNGLVYQKVLTRIGTASTALSYDWSPRTQIRASVSALKVGFVNTQSLVGGTNLTTTFSLTHQINRSQKLGLDYAQTFSNGASGTIVALLGTWQATARNFTINANGGVHPYQVLGLSGYRFAPGGSIGVASKVGNRNTFGVSYEHTVEQAYGFSGARLSNRVNANFGVAVTRRLQLDANANYGTNVDPVDPNSRLDGTTAALQARYLIVQNLSVAGGYTVWQRRETPLPLITSNRATFTATYGLTWR